MSRLLRLVGVAIWRSTLTQWSWRSSVITWVIGQAVTPVLGLFVWSAVLPGDSAVSTYYVVLLAVQLMTVCYEQHTLSNGIYAGNLADSLVVPQPVVIEYLGTNIGLRLWHLIFGMPLVLSAGAITGIRLDPAGIAVALPALVLAAGLRFLFSYILALSALWTERAHGVVGLGETLIFLLGGAAAPLAFLPEQYRIVGHVLPFWSMLGMPAEIAAGTLHGAALVEAFGVQLGWLTALVACAVSIWRAGLRRFTAVGA